MTFLYSLFFAAGVSAFLYTRLGRRAGYENTKQIAMLMGGIFIVATIVFYTAFATFLPK